MGYRSPGPKNSDQLRKEKLGMLSVLVGTTALTFADIIGTGGSVVSFGAVAASGLATFELFRLRRDSEKYKDSSFSWRD